MINLCLTDVQAETFDKLPMNQFFLGFLGIICRLIL